MKAIYNSQSRSGFTLIELMIVVAIIGLLTSIAVPNLAKARDTSRLNMIYSNLRALDQAKDQWAIDNNQATGAPVTSISVLSNYFRWGAINDVVHETYVPNLIGTPSKPSCRLESPWGPSARVQSF